MQKESQINGENIKKEKKKKENLALFLRSLVIDLLKMKYQNQSESDKKIEKKNISENMELLNKCIKSKNEVMIQLKSHFFFLEGDKEDFETKIIMKGDIAKNHLSIDIDVLDAMETKINEDAKLSNGIGNEVMYQIVSAREDFVLDQIQDWSVEIRTGKVLMFSGSFIEAFLNSIDYDQESASIGSDGIHLIKIKCQEKKEKEKKKKEKELEEESYGEDFLIKDKNNVYRVYKMVNEYIVTIENRRTHNIKSKKFDSKKNLQLFFLSKDLQIDL